MNKSAELFGVKYIFEGVTRFVSYRAHVLSTPMTCHLVIYLNILLSTWIFFCAEKVEKVTKTHYFVFELLTGCINKPRAPF